MLASIASFARTLARPALLWNLACAASLAFGMGWLLALARGARRSQSSEALVDATDQVTALGAMLIPAALGAVAAWSVFDLLLCPFAALLPAIRARVLTGLSCCGVLVSAMAAGWSDQRPGA